MNSPSRIMFVCSHTKIIRVATVTVLNKKKIIIKKRVATVREKSGKNENF